MIQNRYPQVEAPLTTKAAAIHVPYRPVDALADSEIVPFPFLVKYRVLTLDISPSLLLIAKNYTLYSTFDISNLQNRKTAFHNTSHCLASTFAFLPQRGGVCEVV